MQCDGMDDIDDDSENEETENFINSDKGINRNCNENSVRLLLTNARSVQPKTQALKDAFSSLGLNIACITETWYRSGKELRKHLDEVEASSGIRVLHKSRDGRRKTSGGGIAIAFDTATCNLKRRDLKNMSRDSEVMCAVGRVGKVGRPVAVFAVYIPPSTRAPELANLKEQLAIEVAALKTSYKNPAIFIGGDTNHRDICSAVNEVCDFVILDTAPTRGTVLSMYSSPMCLPCTARPLLFHPCNRTLGDPVTICASTLRLSSRGTGDMSGVLG